MVFGLNISISGAYNLCNPLVFEAAVWRDKELIAQAFGINCVMAGNDSKVYIFEFSRKALCTEFFYQEFL